MILKLTPLWHGLLTVTLDPTEGLPPYNRRETYGRPSVTRSGDLATTDVCERSLVDYRPHPAFGHPLPQSRRGFSRLAVNPAGDVSSSPTLRRASSPAFAQSWKLSILAFRSFTFPPDGHTLVRMFANAMLVLPVLPHRHFYRKFITGGRTSGPELGESHRESRLHAS